MSRCLTAAFALWLALCGLVAQASEETLWFEAGRPTDQVWQAIDLLANAQSHGLDAQDYDVDALRHALGQAQRALPDTAAIAGLDASLTRTLQQYLSDLHDGRVDPRLIHHDFDVPRQRGFDAGAVLRRALQAHRLADAVQEASPRLPLYEHLRGQLALYRALAGHPAWKERLPPLPIDRRSRSAKLETGQDYAGLSLLAQRLAALGDLPSGAATNRYDGPLVRAVASFQERHGLDADGVLGRATMAQLEVAPAARVRQIELTLERLRWTPLMQGPRMIVVNIPEFVLRAYEVHDGRITVRRAMKVIVGRAMATRTPLFDEDLRFIEFSPYWNVPASIARHELVPRLRRDPGYFEREDFEFVAANGTVDAALSPARLDAVLAGQVRIRQRPGPRNALGDIKFVFPNRDNIYLHHTPATQLFERGRRDFSHGCIRVEQPVALASFVLEDMPEWSEERIRQAMSEGKSATLRLANPIPVLIAYGTSLVKGGRIFFFEDIYGHDRILDEALRRHARERRDSNRQP